ncbi:hypothetical protein ACIGKQ_17080 [Gordonia sp. NPDC062954]|uniref:hypothetical protein n=1 Tax=Gordonia sp. NPDC062954 TaxID=3364003 RepID=UPI0037C7262A
MITTNELAKRLAIPTSNIRALEALGVITGTPVTIGKTRAWPEETVEELADRQFIEDLPHPRAIAVKVQPAESITPIPGDPRTHKGWIAGLPNNYTKRQIDGVNRYWAVKDAPDWIDEVFLVTSKTFILAPYRITGVKQHGNDWSFALTEPDTETRKLFDQKRIHSRRGPFVERLPDTRNQ